MRTCSPVWAALVDQWEELEAAYIEDMEMMVSGTCRTYVLLREVVDSVEER